ARNSEMPARSDTPGFLPRFTSLLSALFIVSLAVPANVAASGDKSAIKASNSGSRLTLEIYGSVATRDGQRLRLNTDLGNVVIRTRDSGKVDYHVHLETDASQKNAQQLLKNFAVSARENSEGVYFRGQAFGRQLRGRLWVTVEVNV